jgi:hypothetical protein
LGGAGGEGADSAISGSTQWYAKGGDGGYNSGGGAGGADHTGNGGGGGYNSGGGAGGSGIVIVRWPYIHP